jgi:hypothetical protein
MFICLKEGRYQYAGCLYAILVMLWAMVEEHQSYLMQHPTIHKMSTV